jgi:general secretion pathway protein D
MGYGGMGYGGMGYGGMGYGGMGYGGMGYGAGYTGAAYSGGYAPPVVFPSPSSATTATTTPPGSNAPQDLTGRYLGSGTYGYPYGTMERIPHVIPNPFDNTLLIQGTPQEWEQIKNLLEQLDVPPRQVLIEAKIYEVDLTGQFQGGVEAYLQKVGVQYGGTTTGGGGTATGNSLVARFFQATTAGSTLNMTAGILVGRSRELLGFLTLQEQTTHAKVVSAPSVIATDSVPAMLQVGQSVPTLTSQAVGGVQVGGNSLFTNTISNQNTGVGLNILARVNPSGIVTLMINQSVTAPQQTTTSSIQSPSFSQRSVQTQVTVQDGDTIAIGGIILEQESQASSGIPFLHRLPVVGMAFGSKSNNKTRTELLVFMTPRIIYDTPQLTEASDELSGRLKRLQRIIKDE